MDCAYSSGEEGVSTTVVEEKFSMFFEIPNFEVSESYQEANDGSFVQNLSCNPRTSDLCYIGQSINFPSAWCVNIHECEKHVGVGLMLHSISHKGLKGSFVTSGSLPETAAFCKFRISIVDKDGDLLYSKQWKSSKKPRLIGVGGETTMPDFIHLSDLLNNGFLLYPDKTLRFGCEGVLYSNLQHDKLELQKQQCQDLPLLALPFNPGQVWKGGEQMEFCDLELIASDGMTVPCHKLIISNSKTILSTLLESVEIQAEPQPPKLYLEDITGTQVKKLVEYIYTGDVVTQDWENIEEVKGLFLIAKTYELLDLKRLCAEMIGKALTLTSFVDVVECLQDSLEDPSLKKILNGYFFKNMGKLIVQEKFRVLSLTNKDAFLNVALLNGEAI